MSVTSMGTGLDHTVVLASQFLRVLTPLRSALVSCGDHTHQEGGTPGWVGSGQETRSAHGNQLLVRYKDRIGICIDRQTTRWVDRSSEACWAISCRCVSEGVSMWVGGTRGRSLQCAVQFRRDISLQHGQRQEVLPVEHHPVGKEIDRVPDS